MRFTAIFLIFIFSSSLVYADSWYDKFDFKSDVRLRHEGINKENSSYKDRMRIRARAGFNVEVQENVDFIFQLCCPLVGDLILFAECAVVACVRLLPCNKLSHIYWLHGLRSFQYFLR